MNAWIFQDSRQKKKLGDQCPWSVGWYDSDGNKKSKRIGSKSMAEKFRKKTEGQLAAGTYEGTTRKSWADFRKEWEEKIGEGMLPQSQEAALYAIKHFERIVKPRGVAAVRTATIDAFIAKRRKEAGMKKGSIISPATVNKELRSLKAVLRKAVEWAYMPQVPRFRMLKEPKRLVRYVTPEDFAKIYHACKAAKRPINPNYSATDWWQALLTFIYMTGWRISEPLALTWDDVSLDNGTAITRAEDNKGKRDEQIPLHPIVVDHLRKIIDFSQLGNKPLVFFWNHNRRGLWTEFHAIQEEAGISPPYGFHDLRRAFATCNADRLSADALQTLMRHKDYQTSQRYINMAKQIDKAVDNLFVPDVLRKADND